MKSLLSTSREVFLTLCKVCVSCLKEICFQASCNKIPSCNKNFSATWKASIGEKGYVLIVPLPNTFWFQMRSL